MSSHSFEIAPADPDDIVLMENLAAALVAEQPARIHTSYVAAEEDAVQLQFIVNEHEHDKEGDKTTGSMQIYSAKTEDLFGMQFNHTSSMDSLCLSVDQWPAIARCESMLALVNDQEEKAMVRHAQTFLLALATGELYDQSGLVRDPVVGRRGALELIHGLVQQKSSRTIYTKSSRLPLDNNYEISIRAHTYVPNKNLQNEPQLKIELSKGPLVIHYQKSAEDERQLKMFNCDPVYARELQHEPRLVSKLGVAAIMRAIDDVVEFEADIPADLSELS